MTSFSAFYQPAYQINHPVTVPDASQNGGSAPPMSVQYLLSFTAPAYPVHQPSPAVMQPGGQLLIPAVPLPGLQLTAPSSGSVPYCQMLNTSPADSQPVYHHHESLTTYAILDDGAERTIILPAATRCLNL